MFLIVIPIMIRPIAVALLLVAAVAALAAAAGCGSGDDQDARATVVVTTPMLGSIVQELVGDEARVAVVMPNGVDPHDFQPSAKDAEAIAEADLVVENGLDLEDGLEDAVERAREDGVPVFTATDHVRLRGAGPPHLDRPDRDAGGGRWPWRTALRRRPRARRRAAGRGARHATSRPSTPRCASTLAAVPPERRGARDRARVDGLLRRPLRLPADRRRHPVAELAGPGVGGGPRRAARPGARGRRPGDLQRGRHPGRRGRGRSPTRPGRAWWRSGRTRCPTTAPTSRSCARRPTPSPAG